jgi:hypothetical protein
MYSFELKADGLTVGTYDLLGDAHNARDVLIAQGVTNINIIWHPFLTYN